ncbi:MAG: hypothetical protein A2664_03865 [Candidatus Taylorbacteria bacterium RIFCSPHIGHO2_01_FULL_46_22b]|uniref:Uncharacterized protein n=1 Tax=Candidatus Taylorbacteria bacterium RIFCSPHIGHO2_01_FULL_46_22b TaxID=1802301 RepID=A0A1G2M3S1_9BACT|nr:MAG: hypothetical protein A2664_03865 [Candidatus Taylorbacteria bacterium RIFCSPHIGHO2_01_FULL_46_22b]
MKQRSVNQFAPGTPHYVVAHAERRAQRHGAGPTFPFNGIKEPRKALQAARSAVNKMGPFGAQLARHLKLLQDESIVPVEVMMLAPTVAVVKSAVGRMFACFCNDTWRAKRVGNLRTIKAVAQERQALGTLMLPSEQALAATRPFAKEELVPRARPERWYGNNQPRIRLD